MQKKFDKRLKAYKSLIKLFKTSDKEIKIFRILDIATIKFSEYYKKLEQKVKRYNNVDIEAPVHKSDIQDILICSIFPLSCFLNVISKVKKYDDLYDITNYTLEEFSKMNEIDFIKKSKILIDKGKEYLKDLKIFGIDMQSIKEIEDNFKSYLEICNLETLSLSEKANILVSIYQNINMLDKILFCEIERTILLFPKNSDLYSKYNKIVSLLKKDKNNLKLNSNTKNKLLFS